MTVSTNMLQNAISFKGSIIHQVSKAAGNAASLSDKIELATNAASRQALKTVAKKSAATISGVFTGTCSLIGGTAKALTSDTSKAIAKGAANGIGALMSGIFSGACSLIGGTAKVTAAVISGVFSGTRSIIGGTAKAINHISKAPKNTKSLSKIELATNAASRQSLKTVAGTIGKTLGLPQLKKAIQKDLSTPLILTVKKDSRMNIPGMEKVMQNALYSGSSLKL